MTETSTAADPALPHREYENSQWTIGILGRPQRDAPPEYCEPRVAYIRSPYDLFIAQALEAQGFTSGKLTGAVPC